MYVDDDPDDQELFQSVLHDVQPDLECVLAKDGMDALSKLARMEPPICIYIDINMPKMNGMELVQKLQAHAAYKNIPAFILSTSISDADQAQLKTLGIISLSKPASYAEFTRLLAACFNAHL